MNYGELKTAVQDWSHRPDLAAQIPTFIQLAHSRIQSELDITEAQKYVEIDPDTTPPTAVAGSVWKFPLPADVHRVKGVTVNGFPVEQLTPQTLTGRYSTSGGGRTQNYAIHAKEIWQGPGAGRTELWYQAKLDALVNDADTNQVLTDFPQCYLYASLVHLHQYTQDSEMLAEASALYDSAAQMAREEMSEFNAGAAPMVLAR